MTVYLPSNQAFRIQVGKVIYIGHPFSLMLIWTNSPGKEYLKLDDI